MPFLRGGKQGRPKRPNDGGMQKSKAVFLRYNDDDDYVGEGATTTNDR